MCNICLSMHVFSIAVELPPCERRPGQIARQLDTPFARSSSAGEQAWHGLVSRWAP